MILHQSQQQDDRPLLAGSSHSPGLGYNGWY